MTNNRDQTSAEKPIGRRVGRPRIKKCVTLEEAWELYLTALRTDKNARPATIRGYTRATNQLMAFFGRAFDVSELTKEHIQNYIKARRGHQCTTGTINADLRSLSAIINYLVDPLELLPAVPVKIKQMKDAKKTPTYLTKEELDKLLSVSNPTLQLVFIIAADAGLRHSEIAYLQRQDISLSAREIHIHIKHNSRGDLIFAPKNRQERVVPMVKRVHQRLSEYMEKMQDKRDEAWLFMGYEGTTRRDGFQDQVQRAFRAAGLYIPRRRPGLHMLRRTFATRLVNTMDLKTLQTVGGWNSLAVLERYLGTDRKHLHTAMSVLDQEDNESAR